MVQFNDPNPDPKLRFYEGGDHTTVAAVMHMEMGPDKTFKKIGEIIFPDPADAARYCKEQYAETVSNFKSGEVLVVEMRSLAAVIGNMTTDAKDMSQDVVNALYNFGVDK